MGRKCFLRALAAEDGQIWSHILTIVLVAVIIGAIIVQFGPILWNHISIGGIADDASQEAALTYSNTHGNMDRVYEVVQNLLDDNNAELDGPITLIEGVDGGPDVMGVPVRKIVNTFIFENTSYLCKYTEAHAYSEYTIP